MSAVAQQKAEYDIIMSSDMPHYMSLDEMHQRLTAIIGNCAKAKGLF